LANAGPARASKMVPAANRCFMDFSSLFYQEFGDVEVLTERVV
jgi:hypothetical protein